MSVDLSTAYLGLKLKNPLVASASPLTQHLSNFRKLEDFGVAAIVKHSLFEEQIKGEAYEMEHRLSQGTDSYAESLDYFPKPDEFIIGPEEYLGHIRDAKKAVNIPIIGSLNGYSSGGWIKYAKLIEEAGADALELNIYFIPTDINKDSQSIEKKYLDIISSVKKSISIPVAVKMSPYFTNLANMAKRIDESGADGLVLFNRFYQPDIDLETLEVKPNVILSSPQALRLPLRWTAILYGQIKASLAATSGIHSAEDVLKMIMAGADVTMLCSVLLRSGMKQIRVILQGLEEWMNEHEYVSVQQMKGSMSQKSCDNPSAFERAQYTRALQTYQIDDSFLNIINDATGEV